MEHYLPPEEIESLKKELLTAKPYSEEEFDAIPFDGEYDAARSSAALAKKILTMYYEEKGLGIDF